MDIQQDMQSQQGSTTEIEAQGNVAREDQSGGIQEIDNLEKIRFMGRDWSPKDLKESIMRRDDYTKKTQEISETKKMSQYWDNLHSDLEKVAENPSLADEFLRIYPEKFHGYLQLLNIKAQRSPSHKGSDRETPDEVTRRLERLENTLREKEVSAIEASIDSTFQKMSQKYPDADEDSVLARAQALMEANPQLQMSDKVWDKLWKESHDRFNSRVNERNKSKLNTQRSVNSRSRESASGGGIASQAPRRETMAEATERAVKELQHRKY